MTCLEGDAINFDQFLKGVTPPKDTTDKDECEKAFNEERANLPPVEMKANPAMEGAAAAGGGKVLPAGTPGDALGLSEELRAARRKAKGVLTVHLVRATGLQPIDDNGKADPYAKLACAKQVRRSRCVEECLDPEWDEELVLKPTPLEKALKTGLVLQLNDKDSGLFDDVIAKLHVALVGLVDADSVAFDESLPISGKIEFSVRWEEQEGGTPSPRRSPMRSFRKKKSRGRPPRRTERRSRQLPMVLRRVLRPQMEKKPLRRLPRRRRRRRKRPTQRMATSSSMLGTRRNRRSK